MTDLTDVLHRATDDLAPDAPDLLLARAVRRGAALRRRRRVARGAAAVSAAAAVVVVSALGLHRTPSAAPQVTEPAPTSTSSPTPSAVHDARVSVARRDFGTTFARVLPGTIGDEHDVPADRVHEKGGYESTFLWNGYRVSLMITPFGEGSRARCRSLVGDPGNDQTCVRVRGGWSVHDPMMDEQAYNRWANVLRDDGLQVWVLIYNSGDDKGSGTAGPPPLDVPDLEEVATSSVWTD